MLKAALIETGTAVKDGSQPATPIRAGGGLANPLKADVPLVLASPASVSFGLVRPGASVPAHVNLADAGGGAGVWDVAVEPVGTATGAAIVVAPTVSVPGGLDLTATVTAAATDGDLTGFVRLTRAESRSGGPVLAPCRPAGPRRGDGDPAQGSGSAGRQHARQAVARLPLPLSRRSAGRDRDGRAAGARAGVPLHVDQAGGQLRRRDHAAQRRGQGRAARSSRTATRTASPATRRCPTNLNPYLAQFGNPVLAAAAIRPLAGSYDIVFDSADASGAGGFTFRFWVDDTQPPSLKLTQARVRRNLPLVVRAIGSRLRASTRRRSRPRSTAGRARRPCVAGNLRIRTIGVKPGKHRLRLQASDYQESRNMENVPPILPNTRVLSAAIVIR